MVEEPVEDLTEGVAVALSGRPVGRLHSATSLGRRGPDCSGSEAGREYREPRISSNRRCLGDDCPSSALYGQLRSGESGWAGILFSAVWFG
jgi:hypothetical protein